MPIYDNNSSNKRTGLFLLRVWCDDPDESESENEDGNKGERPPPMWHGIVQQTVSGEARSFEAKDDLIGVLDAMIYKDQPMHIKQRGKPGSEVGFRASDNRTEANKAIEGNQ